MNPGWITAIVVVCVQVILFCGWLFKRIANDRIARAFVRDMATNHLPHIYQALRDIADANGIKLKEPPIVQFVELNGHGRKREEADAAD
jgi:hypothetical protein